MDAFMNSVSVAMATFNGRPHIRRQLDSLAAQTHVPAELVVTDDRSDDDTISIVEAFAKTVLFPVNIYRNETRLGYRANFMRAANLCQSELIAFCDQDDFWRPRKIAMSLKPFSDPEVLLAYHNADVVSSEGIPIDTLAKDAARQSILMPMSSGPWRFALGFTEVFRRSLLQLTELWPNSRDQQNNSNPLGHDQWFFFLASVFGKIAYLDEPLVAYIQHQSNTFGFWRKASFLEVLKTQVRDRSDEYSRFASGAESRAVILEAAKHKLDGLWAERAASAAEYYRKVSSLYAARNLLYTSERLGDRIIAFSTILGEGGYAGAWGIKPSSLFADMLLGVPLGRFIRSRGALKQ
jgi:glycosyltransferase involved in cell wall biosynthesis